MDLSFKLQVLEECKKVLRNKLELIETSMSRVNESIQNDAKSSAGDKYETSRAMGHNELEMLGVQLLSCRNDLSALHRMEVDQTMPTVAFGSLVKTSSKLIYITVSLGKITVGKKEVFVISPSAPISQMILGKKKGSEFKMGSQTEKITAII